MLACLSLELIPPQSGFTVPSQRSRAARHGRNSESGGHQRGREQGSPPDREDARSSGPEQHAHG